MEQQGFVRWFKNQYPDVVIFAIPNGGRRDIKTAVTLQLEGVLPGVPDLYIPCWKLWIEMKHKDGGHVTAAQYKMIDYLRSVGDTVFICKGATDASRQVLDFMKEMEDKI
jgi:hypothetical protein